MTGGGRASAGRGSVLRAGRALRGDPRALAAVVVVLLVVFAVWADAAKPAPVKTVTTSSRSVPVSSTTLVCPQAGGSPTGGAAGIAYADADPDPSNASASSLSTAPLDPDGVSSDVTVDPGMAWRVSGPSTVGPVRVSVGGPLATTSSVVQTTTQAIGTTTQGFATPCEAPTTDAWFTGFASGVGAHATLLLSNVDSVSATVDVGIYGDSAPPNPDADHGLVVAPRAQVAVRLDTLAPGFSNMSVHVSTSAGRVVAAVRYDIENGSLPLGVEWVPRTDGPALTQTVPGILAGDGTRRLVLTNPGGLDAVVALNLVTTDGSFTPTGLDTVAVPAGQVVSVDLGDALQKEASAVQVTSDQPIVAGAVSNLPLNKDGGSDLTFGAATSPITGPTVVAGSETGAGKQTQLLLSALGADARLDVTVIASTTGTAPASSQFTVPGGTTVALDVSTLTKDPSPGIELTPTGGGLFYAAWVLQETSGISTAVASFPLRTPALSLSLPPVTSDLFAGLPRPASPTSAPPLAPPASEPPSSPPASFGEESAFPSGLGSAPPVATPGQVSPPVSSSQPSP